MLVWMKSRDSSADILFAIASFGAGGLALIEMALYQAQSPARFVELWHWYHLSLFVVVIALVWFVWSYLQAGRLWLAWLITGLRILVVVLTFSLQPNLNFIEITDMRAVTLLGETAMVPVGEKNPWTNITNVSSVLFLLFVLDAAFSAWRAGKRRRGAVIGITFGTAIFIGIALSEMLNSGMLTVPFTLSFPFLLVVLGVFYELSNELLRANQLGRELIQSERRLSLATGSAGIGVWDWDIKRDEIWMTDTIRRRLSFQENGAPSFSECLEAVHPDDRDAIRQSMLDASTHPGEFELEYRMTGANGEDRWIRARGYPECDLAGKPVHLHGVLQDITEQKRTEAELAEQRAALTQAGRVSSLGQLSSALAHEISQPLGAILLNAEAAEMFLAQTPPDLEEVRTILADICKDERRAAAVIDRMQMLLKHRELIFEALSVRQLIDEVLLLMRTEFQVQKATIQIEVPDTLPKVYADRVQIQQVLLNLLLNSLDALEGSIEQNRRIIVRATQNREGIVEVAVTDRGFGISPEQMAHLFELFFTTKRNGTGIGLAISKTIVEAHGGEIMAENNPAGGATLRFTLKAVQAEAQE